MSGTKARIEYLKNEKTTIYSPATTRPDFLSNIDIDQPSHVVRGIGIICTIGKKLFLYVFFMSLRFLSHDYGATVLFTYTRTITRVYL